MFQGVSESTAVKARHFAAVANMHTTIVRGLLRRRENRHMHDCYTYLDLFAGEGINVLPCGTSIDGSPLIMGRECFKQGMETEGFLFEMDKARHAMLCERVCAFPFFNCIKGNHEKTIDSVLASVSSDPRHRYGMVYSDSNGALLNVPLLRKIFALPQMRQVDLVCYLSATTYKRVSGAANTLAETDETWIAHQGRDLYTDLLSIGKRHVILRVPDSRANWTIAICTNWDDFPCDTSRGFYGAETCQGKIILDSLRYSAKDRAAMNWEKPDWYAAIQEKYRDLYNAPFTNQFVMQPSLF